MNAQAFVLLFWISSIISLTAPCISICFSLKKKKEKSSLEVMNRIYKDGKETIM